MLPPEPSHRSCPCQKSISICKSNASNIRKLVASDPLASDRSITWFCRREQGSKQATHRRRFLRWAPLVSPHSRHNRCPHINHGHQTARHSNTESSCENFGISASAGLICNVVGPSINERISTRNGRWRRLMFLSLLVIACQCLHFLFAFPVQGTIPHSHSRWDPGRECQVTLKETK